MKCHYEVLGVPRDADDAEIKTAYRKLALRWHPDKNLDSPEDAKEQFQLVQQAYEVLSDPHERAWYDNHREQILRGKNSDYEDNCLDVFQYFTVSCFKGYGDDPQGFYHVYSEVFEKIAAEDLEFMEEEELEEIPSFGDSTSSYEEVVGPFYAYWQSYCTKRSYTWLCPYNINEIKDRRILRGIEKDMKKIVQKAKRERNEEVRNLVSFVRKRDKRVQAYKKILEDRAVLNRQKLEQIRLDQIRQRKKEMEELQKSRNGASNAGYEEQLRQLEAEYSDSEDYESEDDSGEGDDFTEEDFLAAFEAGLCCKECLLAFKTEDAFTKHIQTKKHKDAVEKLRIEMEDGLYLTEQTNGESPRESDAESPREEEEVEQEIKEAKQKSKKGKKKKSQLSQEPLEEDEIPDLLTNIADEEDNWEETPNKSSKKSKAKKTNQKKSSPKDSSSSAKLEQPRIPNGTIHNNEKPDKEEQNGIDIAHTCVTCNTVFDSKNKLFNHLKKTNHGVYIPKKSSSSLDQSSKVPVHASAKKGRRNK